MRNHLSPVRGFGIALGVATLGVMAITAILLVVYAGRAVAGNSVTVGSAMVGRGGMGIIGVYVSNDVDIKQYVQPLKIVSVSGGAFITRLAVKDGKAGLSRFSGRVTEASFHNANQCNALLGSG